MIYYILGLFFSRNWTSQPVKKEEVSLEEILLDLGMDIEELKKEKQ